MALGLDLSPKRVIFTKRACRDCGGEMRRSIARVLCLALLSVAAPAAAHSTATTKLSAARVSELSACLDQQLAHRSSGKDECAPLIGSPGITRDRSTGRAVVTERASAWMAECVDQQHGDGTDGAADVCRAFVRRR